MHNYRGKRMKTHQRTYQPGGLIDLGRFSPSQLVEDKNIMKPKPDPAPVKNIVQQGLQAGIIEPQVVDPSQQAITEQYEADPLFQQQYDQSLAEGVQKAGSRQDKRMYRKWYNQKYNKASVLPQEVGIGLMQGSAAAAELSGIVARGRQNRYDWLQQRHLGEMNAMPASGFQPTPYNPYAQMGGEIGMRNYMNRMRNLPQPTPSYNMSSFTWLLDKDPTGQGTPIGKPGGEPGYTAKDSADYRGYFNNMLSGDKKAINRNKAGYDELEKSIGLFNMYTKGKLEDEMNAYQDALSQQGTAGAAMLLAELPTSKRPMKYGGLKNHKYFGPPFANGTKLKPFTEAEKYDAGVVNRKIIPALFGYGRRRRKYGGLVNAQYIGPAFSNDAEMDMTDGEYKKGGITPNKAREILHDGTAHGKKLTAKQRRFFGAKSKGHTNYRGK